MESVRHSFDSQQVLTLAEQSLNLLTSHQWGPELFMRRTHRGSDLENVSMSSRFSQEMLMATLVTQSVALGPGSPPAAITNWRAHTHTHIDIHTYTHTDKHR